jgi:peptidoglycan pentaglycine glycine transferase (the first glycine)
MTEVSTDLSPAAWDRFVTDHPQGHILQSSPWGELKATFGWAVDRVALLAGGQPVAGAQVLYRRLRGLAGSVAYVPRGPLVDWNNRGQVQALMDALEEHARARQAVALTLEPDLTDEPGHRERLAAAGLVASPLGTIQPCRTLIVDLSGDDDAVLGRMKPKTRYNIRLAHRKGVGVREGAVADVAAFYRLMAATATRDRFAIHNLTYYEQTHRLFVARGWARLLLAEVEGEAVAALMAFSLGRRAWYFYGASGESHREKMPNYLLQWEAMRWSRSVGCTEYDLWGVPDAEEQQLEEEFPHRREGLWGVYRFKRGFCGRLVRTVGAWDRPLRPRPYRLYTAAVLLWRRLTLIATRLRRVRTGTALSL